MLLISFSLKGEAGVYDVLDILRREFKETMAFTGMDS